MEKIGIITEETADFPQEMIEKYKIVIVPAKLDWPDLDNLPGSNTFQKMRELDKKGIKSFGKTSQPSPKDYLDRYKEQFVRFEKIICISLTSKLSGSYNSAVQARNFLEKEKQKDVFVIDSLNASGGQALVILKAIDLININKKAEEIVEELKKFIPEVHLFAMFESPKWLEASGRISHLVANLMRRLAGAGIRPVLAFKKGVLVPAGIKTKAKKLPLGIFKQFENKIRKLKLEDKKIRVVITHGDDTEGAEELKEMVEKEFKNVEVAFINIINNVVGAPTGPNTLALAWCEIE